MRLAVQLANEVPAVMLPIIGLGAVAGWRRDRALVVVVLGAAAFNLAAGLAYHRDPAGVHVFFLLLITSTSILLGLGLNDVELRLRHRLPGWAPALFSVVCSISVTASNIDAADRSDAILPDAYGRHLLAELPEGAVLLTDGDDASYIVDYLHRVEGVRRDVQIFHRMGRGVDMSDPGATVVPPTEMQRARRRRQVEASLLTSGRAVHFLVPRMMPAAGFQFIPQGLSYRAARAQDEVAPTLAPKGVRPTRLLTATVPGRDPWVDKLAANCWYMEAEALRATGDSQPAIDAYTLAAETAPLSLSTNYNVSLNLLHMNEIETATRYALRAIEVDPLRLGPYKLAVEILTRSGQLDAAGDVHKRALEWGLIP